MKFTVSRDGHVRTALSTPRGFGHRGVVALVAVTFDDATEHLLRLAPHADQDAGVEQWLLGEGYHIIEKG
ncbi:MAG TPA: hypothetical protein PKA20_24990 [Burkholderiaceae bacterium]|nr:hypothetical protein [Burkholderiaceae bacterium]